MKFAIALIGLVSLAGCGAAKIDSRANARAEYQKSIDDEYRACINDDLKNVEKCQAKRALMEANERPPNNMAAGIAQSGNSNAGIAQGGNSNMTAVVTQRTTATTATTGTTQGTTAATATTGTAQGTTAATATTGTTQGPITRAGITEDAIKRGIIHSTGTTTNDNVHPESVDASSMPNPMPF
jgi:hypothetical protein